MRRGLVSEYRWNPMRGVWQYLSPTKSEFALIPHQLNGWIDMGYAYTDPTDHDATLRWINGMRGQTLFGERIRNVVREYEQTWAELSE
jgi:hypothetical protein